MPNFLTKLAVRSLKQVTDKLGHSDFQNSAILGMGVNEFSYKEDRGRVSTPGP